MTTNLLEPKPRRAWLAALLSLLCAGLGQIYNGDLGRGLILGVAWLSIYAAVFGLPLLAEPGRFAVLAAFGLLLADVALRLYSIIHAAIRAGRLGAVTLHRYQRGWIYVVAIVVPEFIGFAYPPTHIWPAFSVPSASMEPTLQRGDYFFAEGDYFRHHAARRGDLAVFRFRDDRSVTYVKRIVGLPGDRIELRAGQVRLNGAPLERQQVEDFSPLGSSVRYAQLVEILPDGSRYRILQQTNDGPPDRMAEVTVPAGHFFMLGDNRDNSRDSRDPSFGFVPQADLEHRPRALFWSRSTERIGRTVE